MITSSYKKIDIKAKKLLGNLFLWNYKTAFKWRGLEFCDFRNYDLSDDAKRIDWLVSAREWRTLVRRYDEDRELDILFVLDIWKSMQFWLEKKKIEILKEVFYILWLSWVEDGSKVWAYLIWDNSEYFLSFKKGKANLINIFKEIEKQSVTSEKLYKNKLDLSPLLNLKIKNSLVFVLTDKLEIEDRSFKVISYKNDLVYINIFDNFENTLKGDFGLIWLSNFDKKLFIDLDDSEKALEYTNFRKTKLEKIKKDIYKYWWDYLMIDSTSNIFKKLLLMMKRRAN